MPTTKHFDGTSFWHIQGYEYYKKYIWRKIECVVCVRVFMVSRVVGQQRAQKKRQVASRQQTTNWRYILLYIRIVGESLC